MTRRRVVVVALIACLLLSGVAAAVMTWFGARTAPSEAVVTPAPTATTAAAAPPPKAEEVDSLGAAFSSGSAGSLRPYLAVDGVEQLDSGFTRGVKELGLVLDQASQTEAAPGVWTIQATDKSGKEWEVGLTRDGEQLKVIYAEATQ